MRLYVSVANKVRSLIIGIFGGCTMDAPEGGCRSENHEMICLLEVANWFSRHCVQEHGFQELAGIRKDLRAS